jgi:hypothetical protein
VFQRFNPSDTLTKLSYVYAFGDDLCAIGGWTVTANPHRSQTWEAAQHLVSVCFNPILLQSRFLSGSIARKSHERFGL